MNQSNNKKESRAKTQESSHKSIKSEVALQLYEIHINFKLILISFRNQKKPWSRAEVNQSNSKKESRDKTQE